MNSKLRYFSLPLLFCLLLPSGVVNAASTDMGPLINKSGMQRMLSQRIAKAYFFLGANVRPDKARQQLKESTDRFQKNHDELKAEVSDQGVQEVLSFVEFAFAEFKDMASQPYNKENAALILDLSETLLETSHDVVLRLEKLSKEKKDKIVNVSGRQRMLSQRIAKYYIAYRLGFQDDNSIHQLEQAVQDFESALVMLGTEKRNTAQITAKLNKTQKYWNLVRGFFLDIKKGGLPITVFAATDKILKEMNEVTYMYVKATAQDKKP